MFLVRPKSEANSRAGPSRQDRVERAAQRAIERLIRSTGEQLGRGGIDILHQCNGVAFGRVAGEGNLVLLGEIDADGSTAEWEEIVLIAELCVEEVRRELFAQRIEIGRVAPAAGHPEADSAVMHPRERSIATAAHSPRPIRAGRPARTGAQPPNTTPSHS